MLLSDHVSTSIYLNVYIIPALSLIVSAGLMCRMYDKLIKLQQEEEISSAKILSIVKKYVGLTIIVNVLTTVVYLIDGYFK